MIIKHDKENKVVTYKKSKDSTPHKYKYIVRYRDFRSLPCCSCNIDKITRVAGDNQHMAAKSFVEYLFNITFTQSGLICLDCFIDIFDDHKLFKIKYDLGLL